MDSMLEVFSGEVSSLKVLEIDIGSNSMDRIQDHLASFIHCLNQSNLELEVLKLYFPTAFASEELLEKELSEMKVSIHTLHLKVSQRLFPAIMTGLKNSNICDFFIQDCKSTQEFNDSRIVIAFMDLIKANKSLTKLSIKGTMSSNMELPLLQMYQFDLSLYTSHKLIECSLIKDEAGTDKIPSLQSYNIIVERRQTLFQVSAFLKNCINLLPQNPYIIFWDLYLD